MAHGIPRVRLELALQDGNVHAQLPQILVHDAQPDFPHRALVAPVAVRVVLGRIAAAIHAE